MSAAPLSVVPHAAVVDFLATAERRLPARLYRWVDALAAAALARKLCPWVLAAIVDRESLGGQALSPKGAHGLGDKARGHGLGQLDGRYHGDYVSCEFLGRAIWKDPAFNLLAAATLLRDNLDALGGDLLAAVASYNASRSRVKAAVDALPAGHSEVARLAAVDACTTHGTYVSDVLGRRRKFLSS